MTKYKRKCETDNVKQTKKRKKLNRQTGRIHAKKEKLIEEREENFLTKKVVI